MDDTKIPLIRRDGTIAGYATVDVADHARLSAYAWGLDSAGYARRYVKKTAVLMHREVLGESAVSGAEVDHINRSTLDNRRANLRRALHAENMQNRKVHRNNTSGHRGVMFDGRRQRWYGQIKRGGRKVWQRYFDNKEAAAVAVTAARLTVLPFATT